MNSFTGAHQFYGFGPSDDICQTLGTPIARYQSQGAFWKSHLCDGIRHPDMTSQCQLKSSTQCISVDSSHDWDTTSFDKIKSLMAILRSVSYTHLRAHETDSYL